MKITVLSLFRDSESTIHECLKRLESLEENTDSEFEYSFYENDSVDNTKSILEDWLKKRDGTLISEQLNAPRFSSIPSEDRVKLMAYYRNKAANNIKPTDSDFVIMFDSDVIFNKDIINDFLPYMKKDIAVATPNILQNIDCKMCDCKKKSYYDSWALIDKHMNFGMTWSCNPFYDNDDRKKWDSGIPVEVFAAFGGFAFINGNFFNNASWYIAQGTCEHFGLCHSLSSFGKTIAIPKIKTIVNIPKSVISSITENNIKSVINFQKKKLNEF